MFNEQENKEEAKILVKIDPNTKVQEVDRFKWVIPTCCVEGWPSCPHVPKRQQKVKRNIGL